MNEMHMGTTVDYAVMAIYFIAIVGFGLYFGKYASSTKDFFFGGQRFAWWLIAFSGIATTVGSYSFVKYSRVGFEYGIWSASMNGMTLWDVKLSKQTKVGVQHRAEVLMIRRLRSKVGTRSSNTSSANRGPAAP